MAYIDRTGIRYGRLVAITNAGKKNGKTMWLCKCDCGNEKIVSSCSLVTGRTKSCGCLKQDVLNKRNYKHGEGSWSKGRSRLYRIWTGMRNRCNNSNNSDYKWYGKKNVRVCKEWQSYLPFQNWAIANGYQENLTLDRINSDKNYSPENCQWITRAENARKAAVKRHGL